MKPSLLALLILAPVASAQYTIDWFTMDSGGGSDDNGTYAIHGTIGQWDAYSGSTGAFDLLGGFWSVENETLPSLRIFLSAQDIVLAWPDPSTGFELQASPALLPPAWSNVALPPVVVGAEKQVVWGSAAGAHFFRLRRP